MPRSSPHRGEPGHDGEEHRLDDVDLGEPGRIVVVQDRGQVPVDVGRRASAQASRCAAKTGLCRASSRPMPSHWPPWPGNTNTVLPVTAPVAWISCGCGRVVGEGAQDLGRVTARQDRGPLIEGGPAGGEGGPDRRRGQLRALGEQVAQAVRLVAQRRRRPRRQQPAAAPPTGAAPGRGAGRFRRLLDDHVGVGAADPERGDPGPAGPAPLRPRDGAR